VWLQTTWFCYFKFLKNERLRTCLSVGNRTKKFNSLRVLLNKNISHCFLKFNYHIRPCFIHGISIALTPDMEGFTLILLITWAVLSRF
jgi:hypothetical protein